MDELRWIILGFGAILLLVIYFTGREKPTGKRRELFNEASELEKATEVEVKTATRPEELSLDELSEELHALSGALREEGGERPAKAPRPERPSKSRPRPSSTATPRPQQPQEMLVVLHVAAHAPSRFAGQALLEAFADAGLEFGAMDIFHRMVASGGERHMLFSVASMIKPGTLIPDELQDFATPGVSLFLRLPAPLDGLQALEQMIACAQELAERLDGELLDETRSVLTRQTIEHLREQVQLFSFKHERARER